MKVSVTVRVSLRGLFRHLKVLLGKNCFFLNRVKSSTAINCFITFWRNMTDLIFKKNNRSFELPTLPQANISVSLPITIAFIWNVNYFSTTCNETPQKNWISICWIFLSLHSVVCIGKCQLNSHIARGKMLRKRFFFSTAPSRRAFLMLLMTPKKIRLRHFHSFRTIELN